MTRTPRHALSLAVWIALAIVHLPACAGLPGRLIATPMAGSMLVAAMLHMASKIELLWEVDLSGMRALFGRNVIHVASGIVATLMGPCAIVIIHALSAAGVLLAARRRQRALAKFEPCRETS